MICQPARSAAASKTYLLDDFLPVSGFTAGLVGPVLGWRTPAAAVCEDPDEDPVAVPDAAPPPSPQELAAADSEEACTLSGTVGAGAAPDGLLAGFTAPGGVTGAVAGATGAVGIAGATGSAGATGAVGPAAATGWVGATDGSAA